MAAEEDTASCGNRIQRLMGVGRGEAAKRKIQKDPAQPCMEATREDEPTPGDLPGDHGILGGFPPGMARCATCVPQAVLQSGHLEWDREEVKTRRNSHFPGVH